MKAAFSGHDTNDIDMSSLPEPAKKWLADARLVAF
jgi:hypothetical protein